VTDLTELIAEDQIPDRPFRREPRAVKRRPKPHQLLNKSRREMMEISHRQFVFTILRVLRGIFRKAPPAPHSPLPHRHRNPSRFLPHPGSRIFLKGRQTTRQKTAAKIILGEAGREAMLALNECEHQSQQLRTSHGCFWLFFFSDHCSLGTLHFILPPFPRPPARPNGCFRSLPPKPNS